MTDETEFTEFDVAENGVMQLIEIFKANDMCGCCVARALLQHGADLLEDIMGGSKAAAEIEELAASLRENNNKAAQKLSRGARRH